MTIYQNAGENKTSSENLLQREFQSILKYLSLYFSSQLKHADLSIREIGFFLILSFTKNLIFIFIFLIGFVFISYASIKILNEFFFFPEWSSYLIVGFSLIFFPLIYMGISQKIKKRRSLMKKIKKFKNEIKENCLNSNEVASVLPKKFRNEKEFISYEEKFYKENIINSYKQLKETTQGLLDIKHWVKKYPWESTGLSLFVGFSMAVGFPYSNRSNVRTIPSAIEEVNHTEDFLSHLVQNGAVLLKEILTPLIITQFTNSPYAIFGNFFRV